MATPALQSLTQIQQAAADWLRAEATASGREVEVIANRLDPRLRLAACSVPLVALRSSRMATSGQGLASSRCRLHSVFYMVKANMGENLAVMANRRCIYFHAPMLIKYALR